MFVCWAVYLPELLPPQLLFKIEAAEQATPLPLFGEMLLVILMLEIIREAGPADAPDPGALCQPDRGPHHRGCRHRRRTDEHTGHLTAAAASHCVFVTPLAV